MMSKLLPVKDYCLTNACESTRDVCQNIACSLPPVLPPPPTPCFNCIPDCSWLCLLMMLIALLITLLLIACIIYRLCCQRRTISTTCCTNCRCCQGRTISTTGTRSRSSYNLNFLATLRNSKKVSDKEETGKKGSSNKDPVAQVQTGTAKNPAAAVQCTSTTEDERKGSEMSKVGKVGPEKEAKIFPRPASTANRSRSEEEAEVRPSSIGPHAPTRTK